MIELIEKFFEISDIKSVSRKQRYTDARRVAAYMLKMQRHNLTEISEKVGRSCSRCSRYISEMNFEMFTSYMTPAKECYFWLTQID